MIFNLTQYSDNIVAIIEDGTEYTYEQLQVCSSELASNISERSLVFCLCSNTWESLVGYVAFVNNGHPVVMLDAEKNADTISNLQNIYNPAYIWAPSSKVEGIAGNVVFSLGDYSLVLFDVKKCDLHPDLALLLTTSGSTGSPKLVRLTASNILSNAEAIDEYLDITSEERPVTSLPMYYSYGLSVINSHLLKGATLLLTEKSVIQKEFWNFVKEQKATSISGVPYTYEMLRRLRFFRMDIPYLRTMTQAGGKLNAAIAKEFIDNAANTGRKFFVMYGQTEATARMSYLPIDKAADKYASIGIAIPGGKLSVIDSNGGEITSPDTDGELLYTGPNVSMGYAECREDLSKGDENNGVLHTGDIARFDEDGYFYITGRLKRFVKVWGNRCNLDAIEQIVKGNITTNCACAGVDDKITVFVTDGSLANQITSLLVEKTGLNIRAFAVVELESIPKNTSGKVQYAELQKLL